MEEALFQTKLTPLQEEKEKDPSLLQLESLLLEVGASFNANTSKPLLEGLFYMLPFVFKGKMFIRYHFFLILTISL